MGNVRVVSRGAGGAEVNPNSRRQRVWGFCRDQIRKGVWPTTAMLQKAFPEWSRWTLLAYRGQFMREIGVGQDGARYAVDMDRLAMA
jgi:hypothetical protein